jgi:FdhE protein
MTVSKTHTPQDIKNAVAAIKHLRPAYTDILSVYEPIFIAQEESKCRVNVDPIIIPDDQIKIKLTEKFPLINAADFSIDMKAAADLFTVICEAARNNSATLAASARKILEDVETKIDLQKLFTSVLRGDDKHIEKTAKRLDIEKNVLAFFAYSSIRPSVTLCAEQLGTYLDEQFPWRKGYCPICGSPPVLSILEGEGERYLICSFCWHQWPVKRIFCPFCDMTDSQQLHYFFSEEEKEYRVYTCQACSRYIKTIDTNTAQRVIYPPLEQVVTLHLDMQANEKEFTSGLASAVYAEK